MWHGLNLSANHPVPIAYQARLCSPLCQFVIERMRNSTRRGVPHTADLHVSRRVGCLQTGRFHLQGRFDERGGNPRNVGKAITCSTRD